MILHMSRQLSCCGMCKIVNSFYQFFMWQLLLFFRDFNYGLINCLWNGSLAYGTHKTYSAEKSPGFLGTYFTNDIWLKIQIWGK